MSYCGTKRKMILEGSKAGLSILRIDNIGAHDLLSYLFNYGLLVVVRGEYQLSLGQQYTNLQIRRCIIIVMQVWSRVGGFNDSATTGPPSHHYRLLMQASLLFMLIQEPKTSSFH